MSIILLKCCKHKSEIGIPDLCFFFGEMSSSSRDIKRLGSYSSPVNSPSNFKAKGQLISSLDKNGFGKYI